MLTPTKEEIAEILAAHKKWVAGEAGGRCANLSRADLSGANLSRANLSRANLSRANLSYASLSGADLSRANLSGADLTGASLSYASLSGADLSGANLSGANLSRAHLSRANLENATLPDFQLPEGALIVWKRLAGNVLAKLEVPLEAARTASLIGRKCRAEYVKVLDLIGLAPGRTAAVSQHDHKTVYKVGAVVHPDNYNPDIRVECTSGIHFFATRQEAERY